MSSKSMTLMATSRCTSLSHLQDSLFQFCRASRLDAIEGRSKQTRHVMHELGRGTHARGRHCRKIRVR